MFIFIIINLILSVKIRGELNLNYKINIIKHSLEYYKNIY